MSLAEAAARIGEARDWNRCGVAHILNALDGDDRAVLQGWLSSPVRGPGARQHTWIARVLKEDGHKVSEFSIGRHRSGRCGCP